ncbi:MAG: hypothetical protein QXE78_10865 [Nitrososphaeria archaeon]
MDDEDFKKYIGPRYGFKSKEDFINHNLKHIGTYNSILYRINHFLNLRKYAPSTFEIGIKNSFEGNTKEAKEKFEKLYQNDLTDHL